MLVLGKFKPFLPTLITFINKETDSILNFSFQSYLFLSISTPYPFIPKELKLKSNQYQPSFWYKRLLYLSLSHCRFSKPLVLLYYHHLEMKGIDIFCASQASTAICISTDQASSSSSNTIQLGGRAIDRHNPIIRDSRRTPSRDLTAPSSSSQPPNDPKPYHDLQKAKKNSSSKPSDKNKKNATKGHDQKKKNAAEKLTEHITNNYSSKPIDSILRRSWVRPPADLITPRSSSRYLLSDTAFLDGVSDYDPVLALTTVDNKKAQVVHQDETNLASKPSSSSRPKSGSSDQVVVLRVSLHCKGCEGKVRKHLSRMQGVRSFNIDFAAKKVTVVGDVTPLSVLASISKVKNAQFWPPSASAVESGTAETKKKMT